MSTVWTVQLPVIRKTIQPLSFVPKNFARLSERIFDTIPEFRTHSKGEKGMACKPKSGAKPKKPAKGKK